jgi:predicted PurR-regulated permease PerM
VLAGAWGILFGVPIAGVTASVLQFLHLRATTEPDTVATETPAMR